MERAVGIFVTVLAIVATGGASQAANHDPAPFERFLDDWLKRHKPPWYDYVRLPKLVQVAPNKWATPAPIPQELNYADRATFVKRLIEDARKPEPAVPIRQQRFCVAVGTMVEELCPSTDQAIKWSRSVGESDLFSSRLIRIVVHHTYTGHRSSDVLKAIRQFPATREADRGNLPWTVDYDPVKCLVKPTILMTELTGRPMKGGAGTLVMTTALRRLMQMGEFEQVERIIRDIDSMEADEFSRGSLGFFKANWLQELRMAKAGRGLQLRMVKAVRDQFGADMDRLTVGTPTFDDIRLRDSFSLTRRFLHHLAAVRDSIYTTKNLNHWRAVTTNIVANDMNDWRVLAADFHALFPQHQPSRQMIHDIVSAGMKGGRSDAELAEWVRCLPRCYDFHEASQRKFVEGLLVPLRSSNLSAEAHGEAGLLEVLIAARLGKEVPTEMWLGWDHKDKTAYQLQHQIRTALQKNARGDLARLLDESPRELILREAVLPYAILAGESLDRRTRTELLREYSRERMYPLVLNAWAGPSLATGVTAIELAALVEADGQRAVNLFPAGFIEHVNTHSDGTSRHRFLALMGIIEEDWAPAHRLLQTVLSETPTLWRYYYWRGLAAARLGKREDAARDLQIFIAKCPDEPLHPEAVELLRHTR